ncbi:hypothetical protein DWG18_12195 [Lysobacter sp. TY2-98]|uniref:hypothetical protein n=1 Tax=Lysobacter sp. TY2-98 TaxID=2290922 RepID=UPI000E2008D7|nr:hypothetical protein [Lysobacter sp. TY2-98]AXK72964.1 hypothetical protein DWG18_12195 [Lysobacter sp. TY2-98]
MLAPVLATVAIAGALMMIGRWSNDRRAALRVHAAATRPVAHVLPQGLTLDRTPHYRIRSAADAATTADVAAAVEALHDAYAHTFPISRDGPFELVLYRDRAQFRAHNRSTPWAEAYYREPICHAYAGDPPNRYHWMLHEATHQLLREGSGYRPARWANEGIAGYFGASRIVDGRLRPGTVSPNAYPIWWLAATPLSGNIDRDIELNAFVPLDALLDSDRTDIAPQLNGYYLGWWSLTHFLMHGQGGRYAPAFHELVAHGASRAEFEKRIGPLPKIQLEWYAHMWGAVQAARENRLDRWASGFDAKH